MGRAHAVVAGGGIAGLLSAAVLVDHYDDVTIIEPDALDGTDVARRGVPQAAQAHLLLTRGAAAIEEILPGLTADLAAAGALVTRATMGPQQGMRVVGPAGPFTDVDSDTTFIGASRPLLEHTLSARVLAHPRISLQARRRAAGLVANRTATTVQGLVTTPVSRSGPPTQDERLDADLVLDATGRHSRAPRWLAALGHGMVPETTMHPRVGYSSRTYRRPSRPRDGWIGTLINARAGENPRFGTLLPIENGECTVGVGGRAGRYPPTDDAGFLAWARELADPCLHDAIVEAEPLGPPRAYRSPTSHYRHFDRVPTHPGGFLAVGDAVSAFNPVYGQGMSVAALEALALRDALERTTGDPTRVARRAVARVSRGPWTLAAGQDRAWTTDGDRRRSTGRRTHDWFLRAVQEAAIDDPVVAGAFAEVMLMLAGPGRLVRPGLIARVLTRRRPARTRNTAPRDHPHDADRSPSSGARDQRYAQSWPSSASAASSSVPE